jgi:tRNA A-37 threonylcarbamoyl transferase component Bud32
MSDTTAANRARFERLQASLAPDLELVRPLGEGSVACVYLAREPALQRLVAVKVLRDEVAADDVARLRFEREAQAAARITHPNVTAVYRVGRTDSAPCIVMEYIEGRTLEDLLIAAGPFSPAEVRRVLASTAYALAAAHRKGIVHRDVRPANVMLEDESRRVVLKDFGIAAMLESGSQQVARLTAAGVRLGDPLHMSPEQQSGEEVGPPSDVYGLGFMGYELLLGRTPRPASRPTDPDAASPMRPDALRAEATRLRPIEEVRSDVDAVLARVITRCLAEKPVHRPRAVEVAEALVRVSGDGAGEPLAPSGDTAGDTSMFPSAARRGVGEYAAVAAIPGLREFLDELGRRKVGRVAIGYVVVASILLSGVVNSLSHVFPGGEGGFWHQAVIFAILAGFPVALALSWLFDVSSEGIRRERRATSHGGTPQTSRRLWLPMLGLALSILVVVALWLIFDGL